MLFSILVWCLLFLLFDDIWFVYFGFVCVVDDFLFCFLGFSGLIVGVACDCVCLGCFLWVFGFADLLVACYFTLVVWL